MDTKLENLQGKVTLSDEVLTYCIAEAALSVDGVCAMADVLGSLVLIPGREVTSKRGIRIARQDDHVTVDVYVIAAFGVKIPQLAWELQNRIKEEVQAVSGRAPEEINIHVQGVRFREQ